MAREIHELQQLYVCVFSTIVLDCSTEASSMFQLKLSGEKQQKRGPTTHHHWLGPWRNIVGANRASAHCSYRMGGLSRSRLELQSCISKSTPPLDSRHAYLRSLWIRLQGAMIRYVQHPLLALHVAVLGANTGGRQMVPLLSRVHLSTQNNRSNKLDNRTRRIARPKALLGKGI